jgi:hypothetical protein
MIAGLALLSLAAVAVSAAPTGTKITPGSQCAGLGTGAFDVAYNFTLAAYPTSSSSTNNTRLPLVLGQNGASDGVEFMVLSVRTMYYALNN